MKFNKAIHAEAVGKTAIEFLSNLDDSGPVVDVPPSSVCVSENFVSKVVSVDEIANYTSCRLGRYFRIRNVYLKNDVFFHFFGDYLFV